MDRVPLPLTVPVADVQPHAGLVRPDVRACQVIGDTQHFEHLSIHRRLLHAAPVVQLHREQRKGSANGYRFVPLRPGDRAGAARETDQHDERASNHLSPYAACAAVLAASRGGGPTSRIARWMASIIANAAMKMIHPENS